MSDEQTDPRREDWEDIADNISQLLANLRSDVQAFQLPWPDTDHREPCMPPGWPDPRDAHDGRFADAEDDAEEGKDSDAESVDTIIHLPESSEFATQGVATQAESSLDALKSGDTDKTSNTDLGADEGMSQATEDTAKTKKQKKQKRGGQQVRAQKTAEYAASTSVAPSASGASDLTIEELQGQLETWRTQWQSLAEEAPALRRTQDDNNPVEQQDTSLEERRAAYRARSSEIHAEISRCTSALSDRLGMPASVKEDQKINVQMLALQVDIDLTKNQREQQAAELKSKYSPWGRGRLYSE